MYIKSNRGVVGSDVTIAIIILILFVTISTTIFYQINMSNISTTRYAHANNCVVNIIEYIKLMPYEEYLALDLSNEDDTQWCKDNGLNIPNGYTVNVNEISDEEKKEQVQEFEVIVSYNIGNEAKSISIKTLKINN